jgi:ABC-type multidrug transport system ATPase subunit
MTIRPSIDPDDGLDPASRTSGHIVFENVEFAYPEREVPVLRGASFEAKPGQVVGLIGTTGCGKSTALKLLERFYDVGGGRILLDGKDIREYKSSWLRLQIATVAQEPKLLPLTIRDNLAFGCPTEPTTKQIMDACATANIAELLADKDKFPEGLRTKMSAIQNISGGEKQRLAIARAILADPPILLLDEATSALDEESQEKVQGALNELMKGRTTLVIAHRLSTLKAADKIIAFDQGKVIEEGTHEDLLARPESLYAKLWKKQVGGVKGGAPTPPSAPEQAPSAVLTGGELGETLTGLSTSTKLAMLRARIAEAPSDAPLAEKQAILRIVDALSREEALNATAAEADAALLKMRATNSLRLKKMVKTAIFDQKAMRERAARPAAFAAGAGLARQVSMPMKLAAETSVDPGEEMGSADDQGLLMPRRIRTTAN